MATPHAWVSVALAVGLALAAVGTYATVGGERAPRAAGTSAGPAVPGTASTRTAQGSTGEDAAKAPRQAPGTLTVRGRGDVEAAPDQAVLRVGVIAPAPEAEAAQEAANAAVSAGLERLSELGVPRDAIQTVLLSLTPVHEQRPPRPRPGVEPAEPRIVAFRALTALEVRLDELERAGEVVDALVGAGLNRIEGIRFQLADDAAPRREALAEAAREARAQAEALAAALGLALGEVVAVVEGAPSFPPQPYHDVAMPLEARAAAPIEPGRLRIAASVTITYWLAPSTEEALPRG